MGLGKTLTMISLILKHKEMEEEKEEKVVNYINSMFEFKEC